MLSAKWRQFSLGLNVLRRSSLGWVRYKHKYPTDTPKTSQII